MPELRTSIITVAQAPAVGITEEEYRDWFVDLHAPELIEAVDGLESIRLYHASAIQIPIFPAPSHPFLAVSEITKPVAEVLAALAAAVPNLPPTKVDTTVNPSTFLAWDQGYNTPGAASQTNLMTVFSHNAPGHSDADFGAWFRNTHMPELVEYVDGLEAMRFFTLAEAQASPPNLPHNHISLSELSEPISTVIASMANLAEKATASDTLDTAGAPPLITYWEKAD